MQGRQCVLPASAFPVLSGSQPRWSLSQPQRVHQEGGPGLCTPSPAHGPAAAAVVCTSIAAHSESHPPKSGGIEGGCQCSCNTGLLGSHWPLRTCFLLQKWCWTCLGTLYLGAMNPFKRYAKLYDGTSCMFLREWTYLFIRISPGSRTWKRPSSCKGPLPGTALGRG